MGISANTLFHFTRNADNLIKIIQNGLKPRFCLEDNRFLSDGNKDGHFYEAIPMVCFCDIPLSNVPEHMDFYGNYGIGFTKEWGLENGINPIIYLSPKSSLTKYITTIPQSISDKSKAICHENLLLDLDNFFEISAHIKPISGEMYRDGEFIEKYFYDEREWRFVPKIGDPSIEEDHDARLSYDEYIDRVTLASSNHELSDLSTLEFSLDDIKYIIVEKESEVTAMIKALRKLKGKNTLTQIEKAFSKIIVSNQVRTDF